MTSASTSRPEWPGNRPFGLFLSHDIDQIHDRELYRVLADLNHIRRVLFRGERGNIRLALRRVVRSLAAPKPAEQDFRTIVEIEGRYGFRSTFFVLHDPAAGRSEARYRLEDPEFRAIADLIRTAGGEIGVHGGLTQYDDPCGGRAAREALATAVGMEPVGIRNHLLRFSGPSTWQAQAAAGFKYDATYGHADRPGPREGRDRPFFASDPATGTAADLVVLPLTVMDATLFRHLALEGEAALAAAWQAIEPVARAGGLVSLLWHNNYFNEPEYADWQWTYEQLLARLAAMNPWCATGAEIAAWWRTQAGRQP